MKLQIFRELTVMNNNVPSMKQAVNLWLDGIKYRQEHFDFPIKDEYIFIPRESLLRQDR